MAWLWGPTKWRIGCGQSGQSRQDNQRHKQDVAASSESDFPGRRVAVRGNLAIQNQLPLLGFMAGGTFYVHLP